MNNETVELFKLAEFLTQNSISLEVTLRFLRTLLENDDTLLSELRVMQYAEKVFGKKFRKNKYTPDLISEDGSIAIEVKSTKNKLSIEDIIELYWLSNKQRNGLKQLGTLILLKERGKEVFVAIYNKSKDEIVFLNFDEILKHVSKEVVDRARRYALNTHIGRPPSIPMDVVRKYVTKYRYLALHNKKALWKVVTSDGYKISYPRFIEKVNKVLQELGWW